MVLTVSLFEFQERIIATCLENRIAVYSPHTSFDAISGGVNDWLASGFGMF
jgi:putative NIF3 family GTP cyclohydrolase 1 type 2